MLIDKRNKLEATGRKGTFAGYCEDSKAFRIYNPGQRKVEISKDVTFDEDVALGKARDFPLPPPPEKESHDISEDDIAEISPIFGNISIFSRRDIANEISRPENIAIFQENIMLRSKISPGNSKKMPSRLEKANFVFFSIIFISDCWRRKGRAMCLLPRRV